MKIIRSMWVKMKINHSVIVQWILSYLLIGFIFVSLVICISLVYEREIENNIQVNNMYAVNWVKRNILDLMNDVKTLSRKIIEDETKFDFSQDINSYWSSESAYLLKKELSDFYDIYGSNLTDIYMYIPEADIVISHLGILNSKRYFDYLFDGNDKIYNEWKNKTNENKYVQFISIENEKETNKVLFYLMPMYSEYMLGAIIDEKIINSMVSGEYIDEMNIYLFGEDNEILLYKTNREEIPDDLKDIINDKNMYSVVSNVQHETTFWNILTEVPKSKVYGKINFLRGFVFSCLLVFMIVYIFILKRSISSNYKPIDDILQMISVKKSNENEFSIIKSTLKESLDENILLNETKNKNMRLIQRVLLEKFLLGQYGKNIGEELQDEFFDNKSYIVGVFHISEDEKNNIFYEDLSTDEIVQTYTVLQNCVSEAFDKNKYITDLLYISNQYVLTLSFSDTALCNTDIENSISKVIKMYYRIMNIWMSFCWGDFVLSITEVFKSFNEAVITSRYISLLDIRGVVFYNSIKQIRERNYFNYDVEKNLIQAINISDFNEAKKILSEQFDIVNNKRPAIMSLFEFENAIKQTFHKIIDRVSLFVGYNEKTEILSLLSEYVKLSDFELNLYNILEILERAYKKTLSTNTVDEIIAFIEKKYDDPELCLDMISSEFNIGKSYIIKLLKNKTGRTVLEFINDFRMTKAAEILDNSDCTVKELMLHTGFSNDKTFRRVFKGHFGVVPTEYKKFKERSTNE